MSKKIDVDVSVGWIADLLGTSRPNLYRWLADGKLKSLSGKDVREFFFYQVGVGVKFSPRTSEQPLDTSPETSPHTRAPEEKKSEVITSEKKSSDRDSWFDQLNVKERK